ncbi:hypothetical protein CFC21_105905 [Triticum aestivum]|uniref:F-box domain-containing protein n=2 Tax=Triticum aestivum TaxID=4565 RepID=A0A9R1MD59_WHEAT|nr:F-box protein At5g07610-like [Triticum aestivum]KAF7105064.1 hypothetical protein CFC21_105905 [Triticum aestivum]
MSIVADHSHPREESRVSTRARSCSDFPSRTPAERLTDDILVEILSRVPAKELCRCKCVSKHWLGLIHHPDHRKRLPQTLAGFFYGRITSTTGQRVLELPFRFTSISGDGRSPVGTSFTFLPNQHLPVDLLDSCNGLLLCRCHHVSDGAAAFHYVVCNPATEKWVMLPNSGKDSSQVATTSLGFDPALSPHFHVFELVQQHKYGENKNTDISGVAVYSSETGEWIYKEKRWSRATWFASWHSSATVFLNGLLFFRALDLKLHDCVAAVDAKGEMWMKFRVPGGQVDGFVQRSILGAPADQFDDLDLAHGFIQRSQGRLHFANFQRDKYGVAIRLLVHVLENYQDKQWILKHSIETSNIFGWTDLWLDADFDFIAIHPECNLLFFAVGGITFMCYNMDNRQVKVISHLADVKPLFLPYVPLYTESQSLHI